MQKTRHTTSHFLFLFLLFHFLPFFVEFFFPTFCTFSCSLVFFFFFTIKVQKQKQINAGREKSKRQDTQHPILFFFLLFYVLTFFVVFFFPDALHIFPLSRFFSSFSPFHLSGTIGGEPCWREFQSRRTGAEAETRRGCPCSSPSRSEQRLGRSLWRQRSATRTPPDEDPGAGQMREKSKKKEEQHGGWVVRHYRYARRVYLPLRVDRTNTSSMLLKTETCLFKWRPNLYEN